MYNDAHHARFAFMPSRSRRLTEQDRAAWASYVRHVSAYSGRELPLPPPPIAAMPTEPIPPQKAAPSARPKVAPPALVTGEHPAGLDKSTWNRFRSGKLSAARTLDLHGKTAQSAFHALERFLVSAHADQLRCVEIITGRGSGEHGGVIRRELPHWLNLPALRPLVLAASHPHAQNPGSTRVLLRRHKAVLF